MTQVFGHACVHRVLCCSPSLKVHGIVYLVNGNAKILADGRNSRRGGDGVYPIRRFAFWRGGLKLVIPSCFHIVFDSGRRIESSGRYVNLDENMKGSPPIKKPRPCMHVAITRYRASISHLRDAQKLGYFSEDAERTVYPPCRLTKL